MVDGDEKRLEELQRKREKAVEGLKQIRLEERRIRARRTRAERAARTRRLIEVGAILESAVGVEFDSDGKRDALATVLHRTTLSMRDGSQVTLDRWISTLIAVELRGKQEGA